MKIVDDLLLKYTRYLTVSLDFHSYFIIAKEIIEEIVLKDNTMVNQRYMFLSLIRYVFFSQQHLESILIHFFLETTP